MKLVCPKSMTERQEKAFELAFATSKFIPQKTDIIKAISSSIQMLESGLMVIDRDFPVPEIGKIDILARSSEGKIVIINYFDPVDGASVGVSLSQVSWLEQNIDVIKHFHSSVDSGVRVILFGREVLKDALWLSKRLQNDDLKLFECQCLEVGNTKWVVALSKGQMTTIKKEVITKKNASNASQSLHFNSILSNEEIEDFFEDCHSRPAAGGRNSE